MEIKKAAQILERLFLYHKKLLRVNVSTVSVCCTVKHNIIDCEFSIVVFNSYNWILNNSDSVICESTSDLRRVDYR